MRFSIRVKKWGVPCISAAVLLAMLSVAPPAPAQTFFWNRTGQTRTMSTAANVATTVNGNNSANPDSDSTATADFIEAATTHSDTDPSLGGGGGDGGSGVGAPSINGAAGGNGTSINGDAGANLGTIGGGGGTAGDDGEAAAWGQTVGELEFSPDDQGILSWSFIHNQAADLDLVAGGGGGGGGAGLNDGCDLAGNGGDGGNGDSAAGVVVVTQNSTVNVTAVLERMAMSSATPTNGRFLVDIGWTSTALDELENGGPAGNPWNRDCTIVMTHSGGSSLTIHRGTGDFLYAEGGVPGQCPFVASSNDSLDGVTGELIVDFDDFVFPVTLNSTASIQADGNNDTAPVVSSITGNMTAEGGEGGDGGNASDPATGIFGLDGGDGDGAEGGVGGVGPFEAADGGDGGDGDAKDGHEDGIFQGVLEVWVDQP